ncbi:MAG: MauE/DoxX family redox-associated membrane protein, partial [Nocardioidaceae bacterium]
VLGLGLRFVSFLSALLLLAFIIGIASVWARGIRIECGCFGGGGASANATSQYPWEIARDVGLLILSALLCLWPRSKLSLDAVILPPLEVASTPTPKDSRDDEDEQATRR